MTKKWRVNVSKVWQNARDERQLFLRRDCRELGCVTESPWELNARFPVQLLLLSDGCAHACMLIFLKVTHHHGRAQAEKSNVVVVGGVKTAFFHSAVHCRVESKVHVAWESIVSNVCRCLVSLCWWHSSNRNTTHVFVCRGTAPSFACSEKELRGVTEKDDVRCNGASVVGMCCAVPIVSRARIAVDFLGYNTAHTSSRAPQWIGNRTNI